MDASLSINSQSMVRSTISREEKPESARLESSRPTDAAARAPKRERIDVEALQARMERMAERLQEFVRENGRQLEFQVNNDSGEVVILVRHAESGEVLRSIPPEEARRLAAQAVGREQAALLSLEA